MGINKNDAKSFEEMAEEQVAQETPVTEATAPAEELTSGVSVEPAADNAETEKAE